MRRSLVLPDDLAGVVLLSEATAGARNSRSAETRATVLGVARTLTSATRLLEVLPLLRPDGIEIYLTIDLGSAFDAGLVDYLASLGPTVLPWREARRRRSDRAVACTVHRSMWNLDAPLMVLPYGAGYNCLIAESTGNTVSAVGLSRRELTRFGRVIPRTVGVSHEEQIGRLARSCPAAVSHPQGSAGCHQWASASGSGGGSSSRSRVKVRPSASGMGSLPVPYARVWAVL